jgi:serine/threonine protein kinase
MRQSTDERDARLVNEPYSGGLVRKWGRHGDLKPENILFFCDANDPHGTLKISDFGEAELNSRWSKTKRRSKVANTMTYRPPECDLQPKIIRQSYDIWCLGCVYMEFVTWMLGGVELWKHFAFERLKWDIFQSSYTDTFFEIVKNDEGDVRVMVKEAVTKVSKPSTKGLKSHSDKVADIALIQFFDKLHSHPNCTDYFHTILDIIQHNMIIVEPETVYKTRRIECDKVSQLFKGALRKCCKSEDYATKKNPWSSKRPIAEPLTESVKVSMTEQAKEVIDENRSRIPIHRGAIEE